jgi:TetR/AcrR family transcriptional repressor of nem operon
MPRDGTVTRERILDAAQRLVIEQGFSGTSVDAVLKAASTSKGAFFNHFPSKDALAVALVERYAASDIGYLEEGLAAASNAGTSPEDRVIAFLQYFEDSAGELVADTVGCLYASALAEMELTAAGTQQPIEGAIVAWRREYGRLLHQALPSYPDAEVEALADHLWVTFEGGYLLARATNDPDHLRKQLAVEKRSVVALIERDSRP